jgi:transposase
MLEVDPREARISQLEAMVAERDARISRLEAMVAERDARISRLEAMVAERDARISQLEGQVQMLLVEVRELRARLNQSSRNSNKPPSSDSPVQREQRKKEKGKRRGKRRRAGGQPGHEGARRTLLPTEEVDEVYPLVPSRCQCCGGPVEHRPGEPAARRHQVWEIPPIKPHVTEYQLGHGWCGRCEGWTVATLPPGVPTGAFGPRLIGLVGLMTGRLRLSKRLAQEFLSTTLGLEVSLGSICEMEQLLASALEEPYRQARQYIREHWRVHADETSWHEGVSKAWLWAATTRMVTAFAIEPHRGAEEAKALLGEDFAGFLVSDRWRGYDWVETDLRQLCWSHLKRDWQSWVDRQAGAEALGRAMLRQERRLFRLYHLWKEGRLPYERFRPKVTRLQRKVHRLLEQASLCADPKAASTARDLLRLEKAMWTFVDVPELEPTNSRAEQAIRPAVCMRKMSYGTYSASGSRFVERILTAVTTLRQQGRDVLEYLSSSLQQWLRRGEVPSLLPLQSTELPQAP